MEEEVPALQKNVTYDSPEFDKLVFAEGFCEVTLKVALSLKKFLMTRLVEKVMASTIMKQISGIGAVVVLQKKNGTPYLQTEGVNFDILHRFPFIDGNKVRSNDIQAVSKKFGVNLLLFRLRQRGMCWCLKL